MLQDLEVLILMLFVIAGAAVAANRLKIPPAIVLVITGLVLAVLPGLPAVDLAPDLILLLVLPPIIYSSAVAMSWCDFRFNLRPISLLAIGCVLFTATSVAAATHWMLGFPGRRASCSAPSFPRPTPWPRSPSHGDWSAAAADHHSRGRRPRQRRDRPGAVSIRRRRREHRLVLLLARRRHVCRASSSARSCGAWRSAGGCCACGAGCAIRASRSPLGADAVRRLLAAPASRRLGRARDHLHGSLHQLERASFDQCGDAPAGHLLLGLPDLSSSKGWSSC